MTEAAANAPISELQATDFVRRTLGCSCPDEVFEHIRVVAKPAAFAGMPVEYMIDVGGRLLVAVCSAAPWRDVLTRIENIVDAGRQYRDHKGFNRFRLVVAAGDLAEAQAQLQAVFEAANPDTDGKMHLHVLTPAVLPGPASATIS